VSPFADGSAKSGAFSPTWTCKGKYGGAVAAIAASVNVAAAKTHAASVNSPGVLSIRSALSQCWSPDDKKVVYDADDSVRVYDAEQKQWLVLAKGKDATWSPDGKWIAFLDDDTYYAVAPSGENRKELFKASGALSGLWWSPDSRIVAYVSRNRFGEPPLIAVDVGWVRLRVRRLSDNSEDWVAQLSDAHIPSYQWLEIPVARH
jgi:WD40 repeat protein